MSHEFTLVNFTNKYQSILRQVIKFYKRVRHPHTLTQSASKSTYDC